MSPRVSLYSAGSTRPVLGLLEGYLGEGVGEFIQVEFCDINAEVIGETFAEVLHEVTF